MSDSLRPYGLYVAYQAPPSMGFSRQEYWNALPFPSLEDLPDPGIEPGFSAMQADSLLTEPRGKPTLYGTAVNIKIKRSVWRKDQSKKEITLKDQEKH